jgi:hypothetical protein
MKFLVHWRGANGDAVETGPCSLDNAIALAEDQQRRGKFLYITNEAGQRLTLKLAEQLKASAHAQGS